MAELCQCALPQEPAGHGSDEFVQHWIDEAARVLAAGYTHATPEDMLRLRRSTSGVHELPFSLPDPAGGKGSVQEYVLVDLGGQVHEMKNWRNELESLDAQGGTT